MPAASPFTDRPARPASRRRQVTRLAVAAAATASVVAASASASFAGAPTPSPGRSAASYTVSNTWNEVGPTPHFTGVDYRLHRVFVSNLAAGTLTVLSTAGTPLATITLGGVLHTVEVDQTTGMVYVTDIKRGYLDVVNAATYRIVAELPVGAHLHGLAVSQRLHEAVVTDVAQSRIYLVDLTTNTVLTPAGIAVGPNPWGAAIDASHHLAYIADTGMDPFAAPGTPTTNPAGDTVTVVNLTTDQVVATIPVGAHPWNLVVTPDGTVYVGVQGTGQVAALRAGRVITDIPVGASPHGVAYDPTRHEIFVNNSNSNTVSIIDTHTNAVVQTVAVGTQPQGVAVDPTTGDVYVANQASGSVTVLSPQQK